MNVVGPGLPRFFSAETRRSHPRLFYGNTRFTVSTTSKFSSENRFVRCRTILLLWFCVLAGRMKSRIKSIIEKRRNLPQSDSPPVPSASPLPYGRRQEDAETAHIKKWVGLADTALAEEVSPPNKQGVTGDRTFGQTNVAKVFEIFFGPKRRRSTASAPSQDELLI
jgi:hypothetical protein